MNINSDEIAGDKDISQVSLTEEADRKLKEILDVTKYFRYEFDIYKFAVATALANDMSNENWKNKKLGNKIVNKFSSSTLDPDGSLRMIIMILKPEYSSKPYQYSQWLAVAGIYFLHKQLVENGKPLVDILN